MKLRYSHASPYARKARIMVLECGLADRVELLATDIRRDRAALLRENPLGKIPVLVDDDGQALYDSPVICEYLDSLHAGDPRLPAGGPDRFAVLRLQALADGLMDAAVARRMESLRPDTERSAAHDQHLRSAVESALDALEHAAAGFGSGFDLGQIATACALAYLDFRFAGEPWRPGHPALTRWFEDTSARESMRATAPPA